MLVLAILTGSITYDLTEHELFSFALLKIDEDVDAISLWLAHVNDAINQIAEQALP